MNIFGIILGIFALGLGLNSLHQRRKAAALSSVVRRDIEFLQELAASMRETGFKNYLSLVKGKIRCDTPLHSELSKTPCVYYRMSVTRETRETYDSTDAQGKVETKTRTLREVVASNQRSVNFYLNDGTGEIRVEPNTAEFIGEQVLSRYEAAVPNAPVASLQWGNFQLTLPQTQNQVLGYALEETVIPLNSELYVIGSVSEQAGELVLNKGKEQFLISVKSDSELLQQRQNNAKWSLIIAAILAVAAVLVFIFGGHK
jgi:hypothetical protein